VGRHPASGTSQSRTIHPQKKSRLPKKDSVRAYRAEFFSWATQQGSILAAKQAGGEGTPRWARQARNYRHGSREGPQKCERASPRSRDSIRHLGSMATDLRGHPGHRGPANHGQHAVGLRAARNRTTEGNALPRKKSVPRLQTRPHPQASWCTAQRVGLMRWGAPGSASYARTWLMCISRPPQEMPYRTLTVLVPGLVHRHPFPSGALRLA